MTRKSQPPDFWMHVAYTEKCWLWTGHINDWGYGRCSYQGKRWLCPRLAFTLKNGPIPVDKVVMHSCDTPACVNPAHLSIGTPAENAADMAQKGRANKPIGSSNVKAKLTDETVLQILKSEEPINALATQFGVSSCTIRDIQAKRTWKHLSCVD